MQFAKLTRFRRVEVPPFIIGSALSQNLADYWTNQLFARAPPAPYIYTRPFSETNFSTELRDAANTLSYSMRYFSIYGYVPERQYNSTSDAMLVRTYISQRPNNTLYALFFMERLSARAGESFGTQYHEIIRNGTFYPTEDQWADLPRTHSWIQHMFPQPSKKIYCFTMTPELRGISPLN